MQLSMVRMAAASWKLAHFLRAKPFMTTAPNAEASSISERLMTACNISA